MSARLRVGGTAHAAGIGTAAGENFRLHKRLFFFVGSTAGITRNNIMKAFLLPLCAIVSLCPMFADDVGVHKNTLFLPWHRGMLYYHERILGALINDPTFRLPVWDWR